MIFISSSCHFFDTFYNLGPDKIVTHEHHMMGTKLSNAKIFKSSLEAGSFSEVSIARHKRGGSPLHLVTRITRKGSFINHVDS